MSSTPKPKITLATLPQATAQEVADQIVQHLLTQGRRSEDADNGCMYRAGPALACAGGCLIGDHEYLPEMEGNWRTGARRGFFPAAHMELIVDFQVAHDGRECLNSFTGNIRDWDTDEWPEMLAAVCYAHDLAFNPPAGWIDPREVSA